MYQNIYYEEKNVKISTNVPLKKDGIYYLSGKEKYWLVSSGKDKNLQNPFIKNSIIGLAWDKVSIDEVLENTKENLKTILEDRYKNVKTRYSTEKAFKSYISNVTNKLIRFVKEIKLGDIIVLKDRGNDKIYFGKIISECKHYGHSDLFVDDIVGSCNKIRKVRWLKDINKNFVGSELKLAFTARHALSLIQAEKTKDEINRTIFSYFYRGENLHIVFDVNLKTNISQDLFKEFQDFIYDLKKECLKEKKSENNFNIKTNVQSPGPIEFFGNPEIAKYIFGALTAVGTIGVYSAIKNKLVIKSPVKNDQCIDDGFSKGN